MAISRNSTLKRIAYHEAGHFVISLLFHDRVKIISITANPSIAKEKIGNSSGAMGVDFLFNPYENLIKTYDTIIPISLAGLCSQTILNKGIENVKENKDKFKINPKLMVLDGCKPDYETVKDLSLRLSVYLKKDSVSIQWDYFYFVYNFFLKKTVWNIITVIATELLKNPDLTLNYDELMKIITDNRFMDYIKKNKSKIFRGRYPIERRKLLTR